MICDYCNRPLEADSQGRCVNCGAQHHTYNSNFDAVVALMQAQESTTEQMRLCHAMMAAGSKPGRLTMFPAGRGIYGYDSVSDSCAVLAVGLTGQEKQP